MATSLIRFKHLALSLGSTGELVDDAVSHIGHEHDSENAERSSHSPKVTLWNQCRQNAGFRPAKVTNSVSKIMNLRQPL